MTYSIKTKFNEGDTAYFIEFLGSPKVLEIRKIVLKNISSIDIRYSPEGKPCENIIWYVSTSDNEDSVASFGLCESGMYKTIDEIKDALLSVIANS